MKLLSAAVLALLSATPSYAANLVTNGDFSAGNTGFTSTYAFSPGDLLPPNTYDVNTNPSADNGFWSVGPGVPPGASSPNMMIINGGLVGNNADLVESGIAVTPNTHYFFSTYIENLFPVSPATLNFTADGALLGTTFTAGAAPGVWVPFFATWNSGTNTVANLSLIDTNTAFGGNDFALDLICLSTSTSCAVGTGVGGTGVPEPSAWAMMLLGFAGLGFAGWCARRTAAAA